MKIVKTKDLVFEYIRRDEEGNVEGITTALDHVDLEVNPGDFIAILGHNGSGKSTLAKHFNAILMPTEGTVRVDGMDTGEQEKVWDIRQRAGMVFQNPDNQIVATVVEEDVAFALENMGVEPPEIRRRVDEALRMVDMYAYREHAPHQLSGGQKQRVAIAGVIAMRPECIVLDEPTAMLDPRGRREVMRTIRQLNEEEGITVVLITHYMDEAAQAGRVVVVDNGRLLLDGTPRQVFSHVDVLREVGLDVPQATLLAHELCASGLNLPDDILDENDFIEAFLRRMEGR